MKNFGELFQGYLKDEELLSQLGPGVVQAMRIDSKNRRMELDVAFDKIVKDVYKRQPIASNSR